LQGFVIVEKFPVVLSCHFQVACEALHHDKSVLIKSSAADLVTETDKKVEELIISNLKKRFPAHW